MTDQEIITELTRENLEFKQILKMVNIDVNNIHGILYCVGGGLNDNIKNYNKTQMQDLFRIAQASKAIMDSIPKKVIYEN